MMNRLYSLIVLFVLLISNSALAANYQQDTIPQKKSYLGGGTSVVGYQDANTDDFINYFRSTIYPGHQQSMPPRFIIVGKNNNLIFGIGGFVAFSMGSDFGGTVYNADFTTYYIPTVETPQNRQRFFMDASTTRLLFHSAVANGKLRGLVASIEMDFRGESESMRLRKAYIQYKGLMLGRNTTNFTDLAASPSTIDFEGANAYCSHRTVQLSYTRKLAKNLWGAVAVEMPQLSAEYSDVTDITAQVAPDFPVWMEYRWGGGHVKGSGIFRDLSYYNTTLNQNDSKFGWGVQLSGNMSLFDKLFTLYYQGIYGQGIGRYIQDIEGKGFDLAPSAMFANELDRVDAASWFVGASTNLYQNKLTLNLIYSNVIVNDDKVVYDPNRYASSQYVTANLFYQIIPTCTIALEYNYGTRVNNNGAFGQANRIQAMVKYSF